MRFVEAGGARVSVIGLGTWQFGSRDWGYGSDYAETTAKDITRRAQYDSNDQEIAVVEQTGLVRSLSLSGEAAIMARYLGKVSVIRGAERIRIPHWDTSDGGEFALRSGDQVLVPRKSWWALNALPAVSTAVLVASLIISLTR